MYNEEKLYSVRSLVVVPVLNFQRDLVMRFIHIDIYVQLAKASATSLLWYKFCQSNLGGHKNV